MNFTIEDVNSAWREFIKPVFFVEKGRVEVVKEKQIIFVDDPRISPTPLYKTDFISFLIDWKGKHDKHS